MFKCRFQRMFLKELTESGYTEKELLEAIAADKIRPVDAVRPSAPAAPATVVAPSSSPTSRDADATVPAASQNQVATHAKAASARPADAPLPAQLPHSASALAGSTQAVHAAAATSAALRPFPDALAPQTASSFDDSITAGSLPPLSHIPPFTPIVGTGTIPNGYDLDAGLGSLAVGNSTLGGMNGFAQGSQFDALYSGPAGSSKMLKAPESYRDDMRRHEDLQHQQQHQQHFARRPFQGDPHDSASAPLDPFALQFDSFNFTPAAPAPLQGFASSSVSALPAFSNMDASGFSSSNSRPAYSSQSQFSMEQGMGYAQARPSPALYQQHDHMPPLQKQQQMSHVLPLHQQRPGMHGLQHQQHHQHHQQHQHPHHQQHQHQHVSMMPIQQQHNQHAILMPPLQQHQQQRPSMLSLQPSIQQHHPSIGSSSPTQAAHVWLAQHFSIDRFFQRGPQYHMWSVFGEPLRPLNYQQALQVQNFCADALRPLAMPFAEDAVMIVRALPQEQSAQANDECVDLVSRLLAGAISNNIQRGGGLFEVDVSEFRGTVAQLCSHLQKRWGIGHHHIQQQQQQHRQLHQQHQHLPLFNSMHQTGQHRLQQPPQPSHHSHLHQPSTPHMNVWPPGQERSGNAVVGGLLQDSEIEAKMFEETMSHLPWIQDIYSADDDSLAADRIWGSGPVGSSFQ